MIEYKRINSKYAYDNNLGHRKDKMRIHGENQRLNGYNKRYQQAHLENFRQYNKNHKDHTISKEEWVLCKIYFNNTCAYCGLRLEDHFIKFKGEIRLGDFHREHVVHGGSSTLDNCVPSCKSCNSRKRIEDMEIWYEKQTFYNEVRLAKIHKWMREDYKLYISDKHVKLNNIIEAI